MQNNILIKKDYLDIKRAFILILRYYLYSIPFHFIVFLIKKNNISFGEKDNNTFINIFSLIASTVPLILIIKYTLANYNQVKFKEIKWINKKNKTFIYTLLILISLALFLIIPFLTSLLPQPTAEIEEMLMIKPETGLVVFLNFVIFRPILEEILFRGILLGNFFYLYTVPKSIILSSIIFCVFHLNPWQIPATILSGIIYGWIYYNYKSLTLTILMHIVNNLLCYLFYFILQKNNDYYPNFDLNSVFTALIGFLLFFVAVCFIFKKQPKI